MLVRGKIVQGFVKPESDPIWNEEDWSRASIYEARFQAHNVSESERQLLLPCIVWIKKFPGLTFSPNIMQRLKEVCFDL